MWTDIDLFLDPETGAHDLPPRMKRRDGSTRLLGEEETLSPDHADAPVPGFPKLVQDIWFHYQRLISAASLTTDCQVDCPAGVHPPANAPEEGALSSSLALNAVPLGRPANARSVGLMQADWGTVWHKVPLRVTYQPTRRHLHVAISRGLWPVPAVDALGYDPAFIVRLRSALMRPGLLIFLGAVGAGKTTLIWSALIDVVTRRNAKGIVLEDVSEIPAEGLYGASGTILQVPVYANDYALAVRQALRLRADYIVLNEVRTASTANELMHAAGRVPIMATAQGLDIEQGIAALRDLASAHEGGPWAGTALANALVACVHIKSVKRRPDGMGWFIEVDALFTDDPDTRDAIRSIIRNGDLLPLRDHIRRQRDTRWALPRGSVQAISYPAPARPLPVAPRPQRPAPPVQAQDETSQAKTPTLPPSPTARPAPSSAATAPVDQKPASPARRLRPIFSWRR